MKYVIIGNSTAAIGAIEGIRQIDLKGEITVITDEKYHTYSRPLIPYLLLGKATQESMKYRPADLYSENNCNLIFGKVTKVEANSKQVFLENNKCIPYDKLLVTTGSSAFIPPYKGLDTVENKYTFMSLDDALELNKSLGKNKRVLW